jgi:competence protein ComEC
MVIGRREDLPPSLRNTFAAAGLAHLLAISGLHVGLLAGWLVLLLRRVASPGKAWVLSAAASWGYVALLGFPAPATRAAGFLTLHAAARLRQRHPPRSAVLAVAVFAVMLIEPAAVTAVGAWLSVAAVWGTGAAAAWLPAARRRHPAWRLAAASAGATLATAPITAFAFGTVAPALVLAAIERVAGAAAALPLGNVTGRSGLGFAVPWTALSVAVFWAAGRRGRPRSLVRRLPALAATASWLLVALAAADRRDGEGSLTLHVLDVGQGDAIAMRTPRGRWVLVDAGPRSAAGDAGRAVVVPFLRRQGVQRLAVLVVSHGDADHLGGAPAVLRQLDPELVLEPGQPLGTRLYLEYLAALDAGGVPWRAARAGDTLVIDSVVVAVLHPTARWLERRVEPNENSVVLRVSYGCFDAVLTGDIGEPAERVLLQSVGQSEVLKVGHHGSAGSTTPEWLDAVAPAAAVISVGRNAYGHPAATVLRRLAGRGTAVWRTDRGGAVTIETDGRYLTIIQGQATTLWEGIRCRIRQLSRLSGSFSSRSGCTRRPPVSLPSCSTTSR